MFKKTLSGVILQSIHQCSGKMQDADREVPGSILGRGSSFVYLFFCSFYFSVLFFFFFFDKKTESKGIQMLLDNMSSLKMRGL